MHPCVYATIYLVAVAPAKVPRCCQTGICADAMAITVVFAQQLCACMAHGLASKGSAQTAATVVTAVLDVALSACVCSAFLSLALFVCLIVCNPYTAGSGSLLVGRSSANSPEARHVVASRIVPFMSAHKQSGVPLQDIAWSCSTPSLAGFNQSTSPQHEQASQDSLHAVLCSGPVICL